MLQALKALASVSIGWVLASASVVARRQKTSLSLATGSPANLAYRSRGNLAQHSEFSLSFGVLVPGAMG